MDKAAVWLVMVRGQKKPTAKYVSNIRCSSGMSTLINCLATAKVGRIIHPTKFFSKKMRKYVLEHVLDSYRVPGISATLEKPNHKKYNCNNNNSSKYFCTSCHGLLIEFFYFSL